MKNDLVILQSLLLKDRYLWDDEDHAQEAFARAAIFGATYNETTDYALAQRLYDYSSLLWFMFSTPILSNGGTAVAFLSVAFLIMFLIPVMVYLITMMKTYGLLVEVEALVDIGVIFAVMAWILLTAVSLLVLSHSCT